MQTYPKRIQDQIRAIKHGGKLDCANAAGGSANLECGSAIKVWLHIAENVVEEVKFQTSGCGPASASAEVLSEYLSGRSLAELHGFAIGTITEIVQKTLGEFSADRIHCLEMVAEAFRAALADHRSQLIEEFTGEKALVCTCFGVSEERIENVVAGLINPTLDSVAEVCNAGSGCGSCRMIIEEIIDQHMKAIE